MLSRGVARVPLMVLFAIVFLGVPSIVQVYTDWLWFGETGYQSVFLRTLAARSALGSTVFALAFGFVAVNLVVALRAVPRREFHVMTPEGPRSIAVDPGRVRPAAWVVAVLAGLFAGLYASSQWDLWLQYRNATPFGSNDPILGKDIGFYVFELPFLDFLQGLLLAVVLVTLLAVGAAYAFAGAIGIRLNRGPYVETPALRHLALIGSVLFLALAAGAWLAQPGLLLSQSGLFQGASYADVYARLPLFKALTVIGMIGAVCGIAQLVAARPWLLVGSAVLYLGVSIGGSAYAA
ncbi:MAG: UPF0182 family protein, partial [Vicinamibacterales bacterium]